MKEKKTTPTAVVNNEDREDKYMNAPVPNSSPSFQNVVPLAPNPPQPPEKMKDEDVKALELARAKKETALAQAKEAIAKNETAELSYKYVVLQLYMKYGLTTQDAISEQGDIIRGGAIARPGV